METFVFESGLGHIAYSQCEGRLLALAFGHPNEQAALRWLARSMDDRTASALIADAEAVDPDDDPLANQLALFAAGEATDFDDLQVDDSHLTDFGRRVSRACRGIPYGETRTYGQLAKQAGRPGAARAVGSVMARNRVPLIVPCHRVVPASGKLGGFSSPQGVAMKKRLLEMERQAAALILR